MTEATEPSPGPSWSFFLHPALRALPSGRIVSHGYRWTSHTGTADRADQLLLAPARYGHS